MKRIVVLVIVWHALSFAVISCSNDLEVDVPTFDVSLEKYIYKVGDTVQFSITGSADFVTFYSGEKGRESKYRLRDKVSSPKPQLFFTSKGLYGNQINTLRLYILSGLNDYTKSDIYNAEKYEITDRTVLSTGIEVNSGNIDLFDFIDKGYIHIAFKYTGTKHATIPQKSWWIKDFSLNTYGLNNEKHPIISSLNDGGWTQVNVEGVNRIWSITDNQLYIGANANEDSNEDWVISKRINLTALKPDQGQPIKSMAGPINQWQFVYKTPGDYKVSFVAKNGNIYGEHEIVKEINLSITN